MPVEIIGVGGGCVGGGGRGGADGDGDGDGGGSGVDGKGDVGGISGRASAMVVVAGLMVKATLGVSVDGHRR